MLSSDLQGKILNTHSNAHLHCRDFGSTCLDTQHLMEWLAASRRRLPITLSRNFVQVEWLLSAIQDDMQNSITDSEAFEVVMAIPRLRDHKSAETAPAYLLGGEAYSRWAALITTAVAVGQLTLLEFQSKLPIPSFGEAKVIQTSPNAAGIPKNQVLIAFDETLGKGTLKNAIEDKLAWVKDAMVTPGSRGKNKGSSTWNPVILALALHGKGVAKNKLNRAFNSHSFLSGWIEMWREAAEDIPG